MEQKNRLFYDFEGIFIIGKPPEKPFVFAEIPADKFRINQFFKSNGTVASSDSGLFDPAPYGTWF
ncbi:MAG: hypothetical protein ACOC6P_00690 [Candidatus Aminicenantaceae bacterium]